MTDTARPETEYLVDADMLGPEFSGDLGDLAPFVDALQSELDELHGEGTILVRAAQHGPQTYPAPSGYSSWAEAVPEDVWEDALDGFITAYPDLFAWWR